MGTKLKKQPIPLQKYSVTSLDSAKCTTQVYIKGTRTKALIDIGANISVVSREFLNKTQYADEKFKPGNMRQVVAVNGNTVTVLEKIDICITIGTNDFLQTVHVLEQLHHSLILGVDFMTDNGVFINFRDNTTVASST